MPSFETGVVLRALIESKVCATVGPDFMGPEACTEFAAALGVWKNQLWGAICNLKSEGRIEEIRIPDEPWRFAIIPTYKGERYFESAARKQRYRV